jgi:hypothetical protein
MLNEMATFARFKAIIQLVWSAHGLVRHILNICNNNRP